MIASLLFSRHFITKWVQKSVFWRKCVPVWVYRLREGAHVLMGMCASEWRRRDLLQGCSRVALPKVSYSQRLWIYSPYYLVVLRNMSKTLIFYIFSTAYGNLKHIWTWLFYCKWALCMFCLVVSFWQTIIASNRREEFWRKVI